MSTEGNLASRFGKLLDYILPDIDINQSQNLNANESQVVSSLNQILLEVDGKNSIDAATSIQRSLLSYVESSETTYVNDLRRTAGGEIYEPANLDDDVKDHIARLARDFYPVFLLPQVTGYGLPYTVDPTPMLRHPVNQMLMRATLMDDALVRLFPQARSNFPESDTDLRSISSHIVSSTGKAEGLPLALLADRVLKNAYERILLSDLNDVHSYIESAVGLINEIRTLATGKSVNVPVVAGLGNIDFDTDLPLEVSGIKISRADTVGSSRLISIQVPISIEVSTTTPFRLLSVKSAMQIDAASQHAELSKHQSTTLAADKALQRHIDTIRFGLLLASDKLPYFTAQQGMTRIFEPLSDVAMASMPRYTPPSSPQTVINSDSFESIIFWLTRTLNHPAKLDTAMRRLLAAATARADPLDGLIDAVLAWESMFSGTPETNLRVCGAMSHLIEPSSFTARKELFRELKTIYTVRSQLVHGSTEPNVEEASRLRDRAVELGLVATRKLYNYPTLYNLDSSARGSEIILGAIQEMTDL
ncbi:hypothetical protein [Kutzneria sp. NPDC052558]|uniref:hypothetical protein n=1 Tax=Kutzneria sp. NPDC052558 TaxID=3364121 RepID=UPI0037CAC4F3